MLKFLNFLISGAVRWSAVFKNIFFLCERVPSALMEAHSHAKERNALYTKAISRVLIHVVSIVMCRH